MASLTPLSKGLIAVAVVGAMASAVWHLGLKGWLAEREAGGAPVTSRSAPGPDITGIQQPFPSGSVAVPPPVDVPAAPAVNAPAAAPEPEAPPARPTVSATTGAARMTAAENYETGARLIREGQFARARSHLEQAVKDRSGPAACLLGDMTLKGQGGLAADPDKAAELFRFAQSQNNICFSAGG